MTDAHVPVLDTNRRRQGQRKRTLLCVGPGIACMCMQSRQCCSDVAFKLCTQNLKPKIIHIMHIYLPRLHHACCTNKKLLQQNAQLINVMSQPLYSQIYLFSLKTAFSLPIQGQHQFPIRGTVGAWEELIQKWQKYTAVLTKHNHKYGTHLLSIHNVSLKYIMYKQNKLQ